MKGGAKDSISFLPDVILQHILSFIPTKLAIRTSLLSKRWRHVWLDTPPVSFDNDSVPEAAWVNETLSRYTAPKLMRFNLQTNKISHIPHLHWWIEFAMSRNVENQSLKFWFVHGYTEYAVPDFFYINSSVKQLIVKQHLAPRSSVSWTSLKTLSLNFCSRLSNNSMAKILSGCPILESLRLSECHTITFLDLSKSLHLKTLYVLCYGLDLDCLGLDPKKIGIFAPHLRCLRLTIRQPCTLTDISSLTEANLNIGYVLAERNRNDDFLQLTVVKMIEKLQHVEKLTFGVNILQILSLAVLRGVPFPILKVKALKLETNISQYVIPGIKKVLQNSPDLKKLTVHISISCNTILERHLDDYLKFQGLNSVQCWKSIDGVHWNKSCLDIESKHLVSFVELLVKNTKALEKMFLLLGKHYLRFQEIVPTLSHNNKVSIAFSH